MKRGLWLAGAVVAVLALAAGVLSFAGSGDGWLPGVAWAAEDDRPGVLRGRRDHFVRGTVTAANDQEILLETGDDEILTVLISGTTRLWVPGEPPTTTIDLAVGDPVLALGKPVTTDAGDKTLSARLLVVASDQDLPKVLIKGRAVAVTRQTIVVQTGRGERAITVLPRTILWSARGRLGSLRDVRQGDQVIALGQPTDRGQWLAGLVLLPDLYPLARREAETVP